MIPALLSSHATPFLLAANLIVLFAIGLTLARIAARLRIATCVQQEVLQMLVIAHADTCSDEVEQQELEGRAA